MLKLYKRKMLMLETGATLSIPLQILTHFKRMELFMTLPMKHFIQGSLFPLDFRLLQNHLYDHQPNQKQ